MVEAEHAAIHPTPMPAVNEKRWSFMPAILELRNFAASQGYDFSKEDLDRAMKITMDRQLAKTGIPEWVRLRLGTPSHD